MVTFITNAAAIVANNAVVDLLDVGSGTATGRFKIYAGTVPADADAALGGATLLVDMPCSNPLFGNSVDDTPGAIATASAITATAAVASGTATFFRATDRNGLAVIQGSVGGPASGEDAEISAVGAVVTEGVVVSVTSWTHFMPEEEC